MTHITKKVTVASLSIVLASTLVGQVFALNTNVFLHASATPESAEYTSSSSLYLHASSSPYSPQDENRKNEKENTGAENQANNQTGFWFWTKIKNMFSTRGTSTVSESVDKSQVQTFVNIDTHSVSDSSAVITWTPKTFSNVEVYYSTSSPVIISSSATAHASPMAFWRRNQVTLRGLMPNTTYYYRVVGQTLGGTTLSSESSFRTESQ
jgi:hypothetical protein